MWLMRWARVAELRAPELRWLFHVANEGKRTPPVAAIAKAIGLKAGVWDYFLPVPRNGKHGLWIELKAEKGKLTPMQEEFGSAMAENGYATSVCRSWSEAADVIATYLGRTDLTKAVNARRKADGN